MLILTASDIRRLTDMPQLILKVEQAFALYARGEAEMPPKVYLDLANRCGDVRAMPARVDRSVGIKWVSSCPDNPVAHRLPTVMGVFILNDYETGRPLAVFDGTLLTQLQTAAAAAVATGRLARRSVSTLGIIGCGAQAAAHLEALRSSRSFSDIRLYDYDPQRSQSLAETMGGQCRPTDAPTAAGSDVVLTLTTSRRPVIERAWVKPGTHINAMGADGPGKQELDPDILRVARVYVDDLHQAVHGGELNVPVATGRYSPDMVVGALGDLIAGMIPGRESEDDITVFDSTGLAIQDVAAATHFYREALRTGVGTQFALA